MGGAVGDVGRCGYVRPRAGQCDYNCPLPKTIGMMKCLVTYYECCNRVLIESQKSEKKYSMNIIEEKVQKSVIDGDKFKKDGLKSMKFIDPKTDTQELVKHFNDMADKINSEFNQML